MNYSHGIAILGAALALGCIVLGYLIYAEWRDRQKRLDREYFNPRHTRRKSDLRPLTLEQRARERRAIFGEAQAGDLLHFECTKCGAVSHCTLANLAEMPVCSECGSIIEPVGFTQL